MKQLFTLISLILAFTLSSCGYDDSGILSRLDALENESKSNIATLQQQIDAINTTLPELKQMDAELTEYITVLQGATENLEQQIDDTNSNVTNLSNKLDTTIATLQEADNELSKDIEELEAYVSGELQSNKDWVSATFATIEQYNGLVANITLIEESISQLNKDIEALEQRIGEKITEDISNAVDSLNDTISASITNLESSMKEWVNEQLAGYYTIAEVDAALELLSQSITDGDAVLLDEINKLSERIEAMKTTITEAYQSAIVTAITENNGVIDVKIANEIAVVNSRIDSEVATINSRIDTLEGRIEALEDIINKIQALDIVFDNTDNLVCYPGASVEVGYTIVGGDDATAIECFGDGGWSASIIKQSNTNGKIKVTAPKDATSGKVVVLATSGVGGSTMKSLYFDEGILTDILDIYEVDWEACTLNVTLKTNLDYTVNIPVDWITVADTRAALRTETLTFSVAENPDEMPRSATIKLIGECGDVLQSFEIAQKLQPSDGYIEFADPYAKLVCVEKFDTNGDGELSYKEASKVKGIGSSFFGDYAPAVKSFDELQYFENVISIDDSAFDGCRNLNSVNMPDCVTTIGNRAFDGCINLTNIEIPETVISIGESAFAGCKLESVIIPYGVTTINYNTFGGCSCLTNVVIPNSVTEIANKAFCYCNSLMSIMIPDSVTVIGRYAFEMCSNLKSLVIPNGVTKIENNTFFRCSSLLSIDIPESLVVIGDQVFYDCSSLTSITIPEGVFSIGGSAFSGCSNLISLTIPESVVSIGGSAFSGCSSLENVYCKAITPPVAYSSVFSFNASGRKIYVPMESVEAYKSADGWKDYANSIVGYDFENGVVVE